MGIRNYKDLEVWNISMDLVKMLYKTTRSFPKEEMYCLTTQMRRSAVSVPSNIAEGPSRNGIREYM